MPRNMKSYAIVGLLMTGLIVAWAHSVQAQQPKPQSGSSTDQPTLLAVRTTAQWCKTCKTAKDSFRDLVRQLRNEPVLFITLDRTDEFTSGQASVLAAALGIRESLSAGRTRVGQLHIINARSKELISTVPLSPDADSMSTTVRKALASLP